MDEGVNDSALEFEFVRYVWAISSTTLLTDLCYCERRFYGNMSSAFHSFQISLRQQSYVGSINVENKKEFSFPGHHNAYFGLELDMFY